MDEQNPLNQTPSQPLTPDPLQDPTANMTTPGLDDNSVQDIAPPTSSFASPLPVAPWTAPTMTTETMTSTVMPTTTPPESVTPITSTTTTTTQPTDQQFGGQATTTTTTSVPAVPQEVMPEAQWPEQKPKSKVPQVLMGVIALFLVVGAAVGAYVVSSRVSSQQAIAPTAPESEPLAGGACDPAAPSGSNGCPSGWTCDPSGVCLGPTGPQLLPPCTKCTNQGCEVVRTSGCADTVTCNENNCPVGGGGSGTAGDVCNADQDCNVPANTPGARICTPRGATTAILCCPAGVTYDGDCIDSGKICPETAPTLCGTKCYNLYSDNNNCGACGVSCLTGTCRGGRCEGDGGSDDDSSDGTLNCGDLYASPCGPQDVCRENDPNCTVVNQDCKPGDAGVKPECPLADDAATNTCPSGYYACNDMNGVQNQCCKVAAGGSTPDGGTNLGGGTGGGGTGGGGEVVCGGQLLICKAAGMVSNGKCEAGLRPRTVKNCCVKSCPTTTPTPPTGGGTAGACMEIQLYAQNTDGTFSSTPMTQAQKDTLKIGDKIRLVITASMANLKAKFKVTVGTAAPVEYTSTGYLDTENKKPYYDYTVTQAGTIKFEGLVSTKP